ncbi:MAG: hypothetical protein H7282_10865, partial [Cytophagaceae bacterium]|nr:hypothetical protein [Cytophagaceae bacterium]
DVLDCLAIESLSIDSLLVKLPQSGEQEILQLLRLLEDKAAIEREGLNWKLK